MENIKIYQHCSNSPIYKHSHYKALQGPMGANLSKFDKLKNLQTLSLIY